MILAHCRRRGSEVNLNNAITATRTHSFFGLYQKASRGTVILNNEIVPVTLDGLAGHPGFYPP